MKKAVVLEIREEYAAVLTDEGIVEKILNKEYAVGQEIKLPELYRLEEKRTGIFGKRSAAWHRAAAAAAAILVISGSGLYYASENVLAYSTVKVTTDDASLELTLNRKDEIVAVKALDEKSEEKASELKTSAIRRRPLSDTMEIITGGQKQAEVSVTSRNTEHRQKLEEEVTGMLPPPQPAPADTQKQTAAEGEHSQPNEGIQNQNEELPSQGMIAPEDSEIAPKEQNIPSEETVPENESGSGSHSERRNNGPAGEPSAEPGPDPAAEPSPDSAADLGLDQPAEAKFDPTENTEPSENMMTVPGMAQRQDLQPPDGTIQEQNAVPFQGMPQNGGMPPNS